MPMKQQFPPSPEAAIASYDFVDIAEGTGIVIFYGTSFQTSAALTLGLTASTTRSVTASTVAGTATHTLDLAPFNLPKTIRGTAYFQCRIESVGGNPIYLSAQIQKWDGTTATDVTSAITSTTATAGAIKWVYFPMTCTETHFQAGDILRLKLVTNAGAGSLFFHDPANVAAASPEHTMRLFVPFKIDL